MNRPEYLDAVAAELRGLTDYEKAAVRRELEGHIEDHAEALRAHGYPADEAERRATAQMGDPAETGRGIAALYRPFWLWVERVAGVLIAVMTVELLLGLGVLHNGYNSIRARFYRSYDADVVRMDERMAIGDDVVRLYGAKPYREGSESGVELWLCAYDRLPAGVVSDKLWTNLAVTANGAERTRYAAGGGGWSDLGASFQRIRVPLEPGDTSLTLRYDRFGTAAELTIDLTEVLT